MRTRKEIERNLNRAKTQRKKWRDKGFATPSHDNYILALEWVLDEKETDDKNY